MSNNESKKYKLGMIGLGTMGRNLLLNMADKGFSVTGYDKDQKMISKLEEEGQKHELKGFDNIEAFIGRQQTHIFFDLFLNKIVNLFTGTVFYRIRIGIKICYQRNITVQVH